ncbi:MAG: OB-fold domain-containing protein [Chloroflexi bacterium]|nr:OB-fold domain-containing protein [Chloroflexota bacterium]
MTEYKKPLPYITDLSKPYWEFAKKHELRMQQCNKCRNFWYPPSFVCPSCWSRDFQWAQLSGRGKVNSWVVFHRAYYPGFQDEVPYNVIEVQLDEGPRLMSNLVGVKNEDIRENMPVEVFFEDVTHEVALPKFRPRR